MTFISIFDPVNCFDVQDIFHHFPRLCDISEDEILPLELLASIHIPQISNSHPESLLSQTQKTITKKSVVKPETVEGQSIQKKITPWTSMMTDADIGLQGRQSEKHKRAHNDLIVVASLIDKAPNLGGLCRTSEILGVGSLVVNSKSVIKDKEFSSVSVTAENWVPIVECATHKLEQFLGEKKMDGFTIVAVEQAKD